MPTVEQRLAALGIVLPQPVAPVANYVPFVRVGSLVHISGQISIDADGGIKGTVGEDVDLERAVAAARLCGVNLISQMKAAAQGNLAQVVSAFRLDGMRGTALATPAIAAARKAPPSRIAAPARKTAKAAPPSVAQAVSRSLPSPGAAPVAGGDEWEEF